MQDSLNLTTLSDALAEHGIEFVGKEQKWNTAEDAQEVVNALNSTEKVHYLTLDGNTLGVSAAKVIGDALKRHPEFTKALWRNMFTGRLKEEIPVALHHLGNGLISAKAQLTVLDLSDNALGPNGMRGLMPLLRSAVCFSLKELRMNNCGLGIGGGSMLAEALIDCHAKSIKAGTPLQLKIFIAGRNRLENQGAKSIANIFKTLKTLEIIELPQNSIYHKGITALARSFQDNENLMRLNLNDNNIGPKGATALAQAFEYLTNLREINFGDCLLKRDGAQALADVFRKMPPTLEAIDFSFNNISLATGEELVLALRSQTNLACLNLDGNMFGAEGAERIMDIVARGPWPRALESLDEDEGEDEDEEEDNGGESTEEEDDYADDNNSNVSSNDTQDASETDFAAYTEDQEDKDDDDADESAYVTIKSFNANESEASTASVQETYIDDAAKEFCLSRQPCTLALLHSIKGNKIDALQNIINKFNGDHHLLLLNFTALKCAHLADKSEQEALSIAVEFFKRSVDYAIKHNQENRVLDFYLVHLGLMVTASEFTPIFNVELCRNALREALKQDKIASEIMVSYFQAFLDINGP